MGRGRRGGGGGGGGGGGEGERGGREKEEEGEGGGGGGGGGGEGGGGGGGKVGSTTVPTHAFRNKIFSPSTAAPSHTHPPPPPPPLPAHPSSLERPIWTAERDREREKVFFWGGGRAPEFSPLSQMNVARISWDHPLFLPPFSLSLSLFGAEA